jgi:hypothetical protein
MAAMRSVVGLILIAVAAALALNTVKSLGELPDRSPAYVAGYLIGGLLIPLILGVCGVKRLFQPGDQPAESSNATARKGSSTGRSPGQGSLIVKRILLGLLLAVVFYFGACVVIGGVAGAVAGANDPANASEAGALAGAEAVLKYRGYVMATAAAFGVLGAWLGIGRKEEPLDEVVWIA